MMEICIAGWYFEPSLFKTLDAVSGKYPATIITDYRRTVESKKEYDPVLNSKISKVAVPLVALEWSKYDHYLKNIWGGDSVLFMHDDIRIHDPAFFDKVAALPHDQAFIFQTEEKGRHNQNFHGRGFYCSARFLEVLRSYTCHCAHEGDQLDRHHNVGVTLPGIGPHRGFMVDPWNVNHNSGKPPAGVRHYNDGVYHFALFCKRLGSGSLPGYTGKMDSDVKVFFPEFEHGKRGAF